MIYLGVVGFTVPRNSDTRIYLCDNMCSVK